MNPKDGRNFSVDVSGSAGPDVTARVMERLGYRQAPAPRARLLRWRAGAVRLLQGTIILSALVLGAVWWFDGGLPARRAPEVVDTLRNSLARGTSDLHGFFAALPRMPGAQEVVAERAALDPLADPAPPSASLEGAPQLRSY